jgi:hypothetical protein
MGILTEGLPGIVKCTGICYDGSGEKRLISTELSEQKWNKRGTKVEQKRIHIGNRNVL